MKNKMLSAFLAFLMIFQCVGTPLMAQVPQEKSEPQQQEDEGDLSSAFQSLQESMGQAIQPESSEAVDQALEEAFDPVPQEVKDSKIPVDEITPEASSKAIKTLADTKIQGGIDIDYTQSGMALSLALWSGSRKALKTLMGNILRQLYSDNDARNFRFAVDSNPIPVITATPIDLNKDLRDEEDARVKKLEADPLFGVLPKQKINKKVIPPKPGVEIRISAGLLATVKNVDELAGQIAKVLATLNPGVYGVREDIRFTQNQKYLTLINQIIEGGDAEVKKEAVKKRDQIIAELSAMERLAAGGFNPWGLYNYEERVYGWMADVFRTSPNYSLGRWLVSAGKYDLYDWSRPIRLQLQSYYMAYLQSQDRGRNMNLQDTEFSTRMKWIRFRMGLFTKPFFWNVYKQVAPLALAAGVTVLHFAFPSVAHEALTAIVQSVPHLQDITLLSHMIGNDVMGTFHGVATRVGDLVHLGREGVNQVLLDLSYMGINVNALSAALRENFTEFYANYQTALIAAGGIISAGALAKYGKSLSTILSYASMKVKDDGAAQAKTSDSAPIAQMDVAPSDAVADGAVVSDNPASQGAQGSVAAVMGDVVSKSPSKEKIGSKISRFLRGLKAGSINFYGTSSSGFQSGKEKLGQLILSKGQILKQNAQSNFLFAVSKVKEYPSQARQGLDRFAAAGRAFALARAHGAKDRSVRAWNTLAKVAQATPGALDRAKNRSIKIAVRFGKGTARASRATYHGLGVTGHFMIITVPVATFSAGLGLAAWSLSTSISVAKATGKGSLNLYRKTRDAAKARHERNKILRAERRKANEERRQRLTEGRQRRDKFFADDNMKPAEVRDVINQIFQLNSSNDPVDGEHWGFTASQKSKNLFATINRAVHKWITQSQKFGANEGDLVNMANLLGIIYDNMTSTQKMESQFVEDGLTLYMMMLKSAPTSKAVDSLLKSYGNQFLSDMAVQYRKRMAKTANTASTNVKIMRDAQDYLLRSVGQDLYKKNESAFVKWMTEPATSKEDIHNGLEIIDKYLKANGRTLSRYKSRFNDAVEKLSPIEKAKLLILGNDLEIRSVTTKKTMATLKKAPAQVVDGWIASSHDIRQLAEKIDSDVKKYQITTSAFELLLRDRIMKHAALFTNLDDVRLFCEKDYFWPQIRSNSESSPLEKPLVELLNLKRQQFGNDNPAWKYDPIESEKVHSLIKRRLMELGQYPSDYNGLEDLWKRLTSRGVSTVTDEILAILLKTGTPDQINILEGYAVTQGRVFDQGLRDEFALRQIKNSAQYKELMDNFRTPGVERKEKIRAVIQLAQSLMTDMGIKYVSFLEELSQDIQSTQEEAQLIHEAKAQQVIGGIQATVNGATDSRRKMLEQILPFIKKWRPKRQYEFLLYLRGSIPATPFIEKQFPKFGPERIRQIYQSLPLDAAMAVTNLYLSETLLARKSATSGYGKKLINYLVENGTDKNSQKYASLMLEGLLYGIEAAKNTPFQKQVLSALIAMKTSEKNSIGETLKMILEQFPGVGPKIGQFLVATGPRFLPREIIDVLKTTQDGTLPPDRYDMYTDLQSIVGKDRPLGLEILDLLGSGSLKYSFDGKENKYKTRLAVQVFRNDVQNNADLQIKVLNYMVQYVIDPKHGGPQWAFLKVIVDGAMNAVAREKRFQREAAKTAIARKRLYAQFNDDTFTVSVPEQALVNKRLLESRFAKGVSFWKLSPEDQQIVGRKLLEMESKILFSEDKRGVWYDTDRHAGNYLIDVAMKDGKKHYNISPIDFGQLTYIRRDQREKLLDMFALATMLGKMGSNDWLARKVASLFDIKGADFKRLQKNLQDYFPPSFDGDKSIVVSYFTLIGAINASLGTMTKVKSLILPDRDLEKGHLSFAYTDFIRAVIQLNQYEEELHLPKTALTPSRIMETKVKDRLAEYLHDVELSRKQDLGIKLKNSENWIKSRLKDDSKYEPIKLRMSREELEKFSLFGDETAPNETPAKPNQTTDVEKTKSADAARNVKGQAQASPHFCLRLLEKIGWPLKAKKGHGI